MSGPDAVLVALRALAFTAGLQAAGVAMFVWQFGGELRSTHDILRRAAGVTALVAVLATLAAHLLQPARMTDSFDGVLDGSLHALLLASDAGAAHAVRILGLGLIIAGSRNWSRLNEGAGLIGATLVAVSFAFMGHTATHDQRWLLAVLLVLHLLVVAFWLGALLAFQVAGRREVPAVSALLIERFSKLAMWLVPTIFIAGLGMSVVLLPALASLTTPYGVLLIAKVVGFALLMGLAAFNKWRLAPRIAAGASEAARTFRRSVLAEWLLISGVLAVTAAMTMLFSPAV